MAAEAHLHAYKAREGGARGMLLVFSFRAKSEWDSAMSPLPARFPLLSASSGLPGPRLRFELSLICDV